jgi:hypothetical protein
LLHVHLGLERSRAEIAIDQTGDALVQAQRGRRSPRCRR